MLDLEEAIAHADRVQIENLLKAVLDRYAVLFPDWETATFSLPRSPDRDQHIDRMITLLRGMKTSS